MTAGVPEDQANWKQTETSKAAKYYTYAKPIEKSPQDDREYRLIRLHNGLQAMLVHDAKADKAAASLDVAVGHLNDPDDMPGLAHFCEHLLFMGTEQFPKENEYSEYLSKNNGHSNAYTASSKTNYYFNVGTPALKGALMRFAGFFHSPLFSPSCTTRELNAVDSENKKNLQNDMWRIFQVNKYLSKPGHPWSKFGSGNKDSLTRVGRELKAKESVNGRPAVTENGNLAASLLPSRTGSPVPSVNSINDNEADGGVIGRETRRRLIEWWTANYCASRMRLCVIGQESLDELSETVIELFSPIVNRSKDPLPMITDHPFGPAEKGTLVSVQTIMAIHILEISFPLAYQPPLWQHKPGTLLGDFVGHEGPGSLHSYLKEKGWITGLGSGSQNLGRGFAMFKVTLHLTKDGFQDHRTVALAVFDYLSLLRSSDVAAWYSQEYAKISQIRFRFAEKSRPEDYAVWVAEHLAWPVPRDLVLKAPQVLWEWDAAGAGEAEFRKTLEGLKVDEGRAVLMGRKEEHDAIEGAGEWKKEPWYGTPYKVQKLDDEFMKTAAGASTIPDLHLPRPNEFIPQNLDVEKRDVAEIQRRPHLIRETPSLSLWHKKDDRFWVPKANMIVDVRTPFANNSPHSAVLTRLFTNLVTDALNEYAYAADLAGLRYNLSHSSLGIYVSLSGYNDKLHVLLKDILEKVKCMQIRQDRLDVIREQMKRDWENFFLSQSYQISDYYTRYIMADGQWTIPEMLEVLPSITKEQIEEHGRKMLSKTHSLILVQGNVYKDDAIKLAKTVEEIVDGTPVPASEIVDLGRIVPPGSNYVWQSIVPNPNEPNSSLSYYLHFGSYNDRRLRVASALLTQILAEPAFNILRTKEQLGYIVFASQWASQGLHEVGLRVVVQSERAPAYLEERVEAFLSHMRGVLEAMPDAEIEEQKKGLERKRREEAKNLGEEANRYWTHIDSGYLDFYRRNEDADYIHSITKAEVISLFSQYLDPSSPKRAKLSVHLRSQKPRPKHVSEAAMDAFIAHLAEAGVNVDDVKWREELEGEPAMSDFTKYWKVLLAERAPEKVDELLGMVDGLVQRFPATVDAEGKLRADVKLVDDLKAFKQGLRITERPRPLVEWNDLPVSRF